MSAPDRSWTVAPTLLWFGAVLVGALITLDGGVQAIADRFSEHHSGASRPTGPVFTALHASETDDTDTSDVSEPLPPPVAGSHDVGQLDDVCLDGTDTACKRWAMDGFYKAIADEKKGVLGRPVRVSWYGDSVIASDAIPGRLRKRLQDELGDGGPGFVFAVPPHRFNGHEAITRAIAGGWASHAISVLQTPDGLYGPGGATAETDGGRTTIKLVSGTVTNLELYYLTQPHGGSVAVSSGGQQLLHADTAGEQKAAGYTAATVAGVSKIDVDTKGRVRLFGVDLENASGAIVDNFGVVSVNVKSWMNADQTHWTEELAHRGADLILVTIGANEAHWLAPGDKDTKDYQGHYEQLLEPIRKSRPDATCLVVSPTDQAEAKDDSYVSRPVMPLLVEAQRKAAHAQGCAFYSTYDWMGGKGSSLKWFRKGLIEGDFTHMTQKGADKLADGLYDAVMTGYQRYAPH